MRTEADGRFRIGINAVPSGRIYTTLLARGDDDRLGLLPVSQEKPEPLKVVLRPARSVEVRVVGKNATVQAHGVKFYQKRAVRKSLEGVPALSGLRSTIEVVD